MEGARRGNKRRRGKREEESRYLLTQQFQHPVPRLRNCPVVSHYSETSQTYSNLEWRRRGGGGGGEGGAEGEEEEI